MTTTISSALRRLAGIQTFTAFHHRNFPLLFLSTLTMAIGSFMQMVALGWLVLEMTDSPMSLGMVWAVRSSPYLIFGMLAGAVADKVNRRTLLIVGSAIVGFCALILGLLIASDVAQLWNILVLTFFIGSVLTFDMTVRQVFVVDIVGREDAMSAISMNAVAMRIMGVIGGGAAGLIIEAWGIEWPFFVMAITYAVGILILFNIRSVVRISAPVGQSVWGNLVEGLKLLGKSQIILILFILALVTEIFGFSYMVVLPIFSRDILDIGASGLGWLNSVMSIGGLIGALVLASLGDFSRKGLLLIGIFFLFGVFLVLFSQSQIYGLSLFLMAGVGMMAAGFDAMQHTLLQLNVSEEQRGRAMGIWIFSIGTMPIGSLMIGAVSDWLGAQTAVVINGIVIVLLSIIVILMVPRLRRA